MTCHLTTTSIWTTEDLHAPTILSVLFSKLNGALAVAIEAERDIVDISVWDPAVDAWLREAERAWDAVLDMRHALLAAPLTHAEEKALLSMVGIADAVMSAETISAFGAAHDRLRAATFFRQRLGRGHLPHRISALLDQCHAHLSAVAQLDLYQPVCDPEDLPYGLTEAWAEAC
ncbi:hypothetical protein [Roseovarius arcticus]|uniref:hypothetical protein n=1 Tax=Roseovarius arcticus TaxID=2547404 RepID=UPI001110CFF8|nr:hypothetical protein [Roseovarius arcticus]